MEPISSWLPPAVREAIRSLGQDEEIYLVGGAVRDAILGKPCRDFDFSLAGNTRKKARQIADILGGDFYPLDEDRQMMRVLWYPDARDTITLDFTPIQGGMIEADLSQRDFTINAMAAGLGKTEKLLDPLNGTADLREGILRRCGPGSILADPVRAVRAVRLATQFSLKIEGQTREEIHAAAVHLGKVSAERVRDELFRLLSGSRVAMAIRLLDQFDLLEKILPEIPQLKGVQQGKAHEMDVYEHTLACVNRLEKVLDLFDPAADRTSISDLTSAQVITILGTFRSGIADHLGERITEERKRRAILFFSTLYHDSGKLVSTTMDENGDLHSYGHESTGAHIAVERGRALSLSNLETAMIGRIVQNHMRPNFLRKAQKNVSRRGIYRYFRESGEEGVEICLLSLADMLAKRAGPPNLEDWLGLLEVNRSLLDAWYEHREEMVHPPKLIGGDALMKELEIPPGPLVGKLLAEIAEQQAMGKIQTREDALRFSRNGIASAGEEEKDDA